MYMNICVYQSECVRVYIWGTCVYLWKTESQKMSWSPVVRHLVLALLWMSFPWLWSLCLCLCSISSFTHKHCLSEKIFPPCIPGKSCFFHNNWFNCNCPHKVSSGLHVLQFNPCDPSYGCELEVRCQYSWSGECWGHWKKNELRGRVIVLHIEFKPYIHCNHL